MVQRIDGSKDVVINLIKHENNMTSVSLYTDGAHKSTLTPTQADGIWSVVLPAKEIRQMNESILIGEMHFEDGSVIKKQLPFWVDTNSDVLPADEIRFYTKTQTEEKLEAMKVETESFVDEKLTSVYTKAETEALIEAIDLSELQTNTNNRAPAVTADFDTDISLPTTQKSWTFELFFSLDAGSYDIQILKGAQSSPLAGGVTLRKIGDLKISEFKHPFESRCDINKQTSSTVLKPINHLIVNTSYSSSSKKFIINLLLNNLTAVSANFSCEESDVPNISKNGGMWVPNIFNVTNDRVGKIYCYRVYSGNNEIYQSINGNLFKQGRFWESSISNYEFHLSNFYKSMVLDFTPQGIHGDVWKSNIAGDKYSMKLGNNPIFDHYEFLDDYFGHGEPTVNTDKVLDGARYTDVYDYSSPKVYTKQGSSWTPVGAGAGGSDSIEEVHDLMNSYGNLTAGKIYHADCGNNIYYPFIWTGGGNSHECFHPLAPIRGWGAPDWSLNTYVLIPGLQFIDMNTTIVYVNQGLWSGDWQMKG